MPTDRKGSSDTCCLPKVVDVRTESIFSLSSIATSVMSEDSNSEEEESPISRANTTASDISPISQGRSIFTKVVKPPHVRRQRGFNRAPRHSCPDAKSIIGALPLTTEGALAHFCSVVRSQVSQAKIAYIGADKVTMPPDVLNLANAKLTEFPSELADARHLFILTEDVDAALCTTNHILRSRSPVEGGAVIVALIGASGPVDFLSISSNVSTLMRSGAHDVFMLPTETQQLHVALAMSLAKADANREHEAYLEHKLRASRKQCDNLFWQIADEIVQDFPAVRPQLKERKGKSVGNVVLGRKVGEGTSGTVHLWQDPAKGKNGAVKVMAKDTIKSVDQVVQIANEYFLMRRLSHQNVVGSSDFVHGPHNLYIFMEFAGNNNLFRMLRTEQGLPLAQMEDLFTQIARGVAHCHEMKVAHCDLKPENIVLNNGCAKIVDFGEAVDLAQEILPLQTPKGTMPFMSPEILYVSASWVPPAVDVWALAVVLLELMCGVGAFVKFIGWSNESLAANKEHADDLTAIFGESCSNTDGFLMRIAHSCKKSQSPAFLQLLTGMFELTPEKRSSSQHVVEQISMVF